MRKTSIYLRFALGLLLLAQTIAYTRAQAIKDPHARWEPEIKSFETADINNPPPAEPLLFLGSSSIRLWKTLGQDFKGLPVLNRGFGGSEIADSTHFADRIVLPYRPRQILMYAGDNDLASGKSPEQVSADFQAFVRKIHANLPKTSIAFISIKPSPSRWKLVAQMRTANHLIEEFIRTDRQLAFIDVFSPMLGKDGRPRLELFAEDQLHLNEQGYALWTSIVRPYLSTEPGRSAAATAQPSSAGFRSKRCAARCRDRKSLCESCLNRLSGATWH